MRHVASAGMFLLFAIGASAVAAKEPAASQAPPAISRVVACTSVMDSGQRLACFDREVAAMSQAQRTGDLVAMDRQQIRKTRRSLFGLSLPDLGVFGDSKNDDGPSEIVTTIKSARQDPRGAWTIDLAEGGRWLQIDSRPFVIDPAPGQPIRIKRAALGSYLANVNKQVAVRVRRIL